MSHSEKPVALLTGATGAIGPTLVNLLLDRGYRVRIFVRKPPENRLAGGIEIVHGDLVSGQGLLDAVDGVDTVFHLAAKLHINNPTPDMFDEYRKVNIGGTERLASAADRADVSCRGATNRIQR